MFGIPYVKCKPETGYQIGADAMALDPERIMKLGDAAGPGPRLFEGSHQSKIKALLDENFHRMNPWRKG